MKIRIEGQEYPFPDMDSITMDEAIVLERTAGVTLDELMPGEALPVGAVKGFIVVALMREHPQATEQEIGERIGKLKLSEMQELTVTEEEDASPPVESESEDSEEASGDDTSKQSESFPDAAAPKLSGIRGSVTTSTSDRKTSAA